MNSNKWNEDNLRQLLVSQQKDYYENGLEHELFAETDEVFNRQWIYHRLKILSLIPEECRKSGKKVVDVGGGKGRISTLLSDFGLECVNIDRLFSDERAKNLEGKKLAPILKSYCEKKGVKVMAQDVLLDGIPYPDESFDLAICSEVIEHLPNSPKPIISEIYRILTKGGYLIITTPNIASIEKRKRMLLGNSIHGDLSPFYKFERGYSAGTVFRGHIREFVKKEVEQMLVWENFDIINSQTYDYSSPTGFRDLVTCWLSGSTGLGYILKKMRKDMNDFIVVLAKK